MLLLEPLSETPSGRGGSLYQPCRILVHQGRQQIELFNIVTDSNKIATNGNELPELPSEWKFEGKDIRRVSLHNEDELCLYMCVPPFATLSAPVRCSPTLNGIPSIFVSKPTGMLTHATFSFFLRRRSRACCSTRLRAN